MSTYGYAGQNPVMAYDPTGEFFWFLAVGGIAGGDIIGATILSGLTLILAYQLDQAVNNVDSMVNDRPWRDKSGRWKVYVRCNVQTFDDCENCPSTIGGWGYGNTFSEANTNAQHDANANLSGLGAKGCYKRHCDPVSCFENGKPVRCPRSGRTQR